MPELKYTLGRQMMYRQTDIGINRYRLDIEIDIDLDIVNADMDK